MIDTIRFKTSLTLKPASSLPKDWKDAGFEVKRGKDAERVFSRLTHQPTKIRVMRNPFSDPEHPWEIEASLPVVLHGSNSQLLKNQFEVNKAFDALHEQIKRITKTYAGPKAFTRIDLCWHVPANLRDIIETHMGLTPPNLEGKHIIWWGETILWEAKGKKGKAKKVRQQIYDKRKERTSKAQGHVARLEIQYRGEKEISLLSFMRPSQFRPVSFKRAYLVLRSRFCSLGDCPRFPGSKEAARKRMKVFGIHWPTLLPEKPPKKFKLLHGCDIPDVPKYPDDPYA